MKFDNVKVHKMGSRLGIAFSTYFFPKGSLIEIKVIKENKQKIVITKFNRIITLRRDVENCLNLKHHEVIVVEIHEIKNLERTKELFYNDKINMLSLIPEKTSKGYKILVNEFNKNDENWLRIWYSHERGSGQQLEIRRYMDIETIGRLLGQYQAEGTKHKDGSHKFYVQFTNKLVQEHKEFMNYLSNLGITENMFEFRFVYNPIKISENQVNEYLNQFKTAINYPVKLSCGNSKGIGFGQTIRNVLLTEIIINSLDKIRNLLANENKYNLNQKKLTECFVSKLLTGDGTLDVRCTRRDFPELCIKIVDEDLNYLNDYCKILRNLGFKTRVNEKRISVISSCSFKGLLYLYRIKAFKNSNNWNKLIVAIALCLKGRRYYTYLRFLELYGYGKFSTSFVNGLFQLKPNMASDWLNNKVSENLIIKNQYNSWSMTSEGESFSSTLKIWNNDYQNLMKLKNIDNPFQLLETVKVKKFKTIKCLTEERPESHRSLLL